MNEEIKAKIISAVTSKTLPLKDLAKKLFISERQLVTLLKDWNVEIPGKRTRTKIDTPLREELMQIYSEKNNVSDVSKHYKVSVNREAQWMKDLSIPTRKLVMTPEERKTLLEKHIGMLKDLDL